MKKIFLVLGNILVSLSTEGLTMEHTIDAYKGASERNGTWIKDMGSVKDVINLFNKNPNLIDEQWNIALQQSYEIFSERAEEEIRCKISFKAILALLIAHPNLIDDHWQTLLRQSYEIFSERAEEGIRCLAPTEAILSLLIAHPNLINDQWQTLLRQSYEIFSEQEGVGIRCLAPTGGIISLLRKNLNLINEQWNIALRQSYEIFSEQEGREIRSEVYFKAILALLTARPNLIDDDWIEALSQTWQDSDDQSVLQEIRNFNRIVNLGLLDRNDLDLGLNGRVLHRAHEAITNTDLSYYKDAAQRFGRFEGELSQIHIPFESIDKSNQEAVKKQWNRIPEEHRRVIIQVIHANPKKVQEPWQLALSHLYLAAIAHPEWNNQETCSDGIRRFGIAMLREIDPAVTFYLGETDFSTRLGEELKDSKERKKVENQRKIYRVLAGIFFNKEKIKKLNPQENRFRDRLKKTVSRVLKFSKASPDKDYTDYLFKIMADRYEKTNTELTAVERVILKASGNMEDFAQDLANAIVEDEKQGQFQQNLEAWEGYLQNILQDRFDGNIQNSYNKAIAILKNNLPSYLKELEERKKIEELDNSEKKEVKAKEECEGEKTGKKRNQNRTPCCSIF